MKFKKFLSLLASATMAVTALTGAMTASADDSGTCGDVKWTFDSSTGVLTISGTGAMASPEVSGSKEQSKQDYLDTYTYKVHKNEIKEVIIEEGVTDIGYCAFYGFPNLVTVEIPSTAGFTQIKGANTTGNNANCYAFADCTSLKNLTLADGLEVIGGYAFNGCTALESVTIPASVTEWHYYSFYECSSLKNINLEEGLIVIGAAAFAETAVESVVIPSTIEKWESVQTRDRVLDLDNGACVAFGNCEKLSSVTLKEGIKTLTDSPFKGCPLLKKIVVPSTVTKLNFAFQGCTDLEEVYIEEGAQVDALGSGVNMRLAFTNCTSLKRLEIPAGVDLSYQSSNSTGNWCNGCSSLEDIYLHGKNYSGEIPVANSTAKYHVYAGSTTENSLISNGVSFSRIVSLKTDIKKAKDALDKAVEKAQAYVDAEDIYTPESFGVLKALLEKASKYGDDSNVMSIEDTTDGIYAAIKDLKEKSEEPPSSNPSSSEPSSDNSEPSSDSSKPKTDPTTSPTKAPSTKATRSPAQVTKDKNNAQKTMNQAKITSLKAKAKGKKKIVVSWKKVTKAVGYEVQVAKNNKFKKAIVDTFTSNVKLTIADKKIKSKKTYFVRVRAYSTYKDANNKPQKVYSKWIKKTRKVKVK